jgi:hypothetical protein
MRQPIIPHQCTSPNQNWVFSGLKKRKPRQVRAARTRLRSEGRQRKISRRRSSLKERMVVTVGGCCFAVGDCRRRRRGGDCEDMGANAGKWKASPVILIPVIRCWEQMGRLLWFTYLGPYCACGQLQGLSTILSMCRGNVLSP